MLELLLCSLLTILPDYLFRRYVQGRRLGKEITFYSVWFELRWGITGCLVLTVSLITTVFYNHPSTTNVTLFYRTVPILPETNGRVAEIYVGISGPIAKGEPIFRLDSSKQEAAAETARRKIAELDAEMVVARADVQKAEGQIQQAESDRKQTLDELETKQELYRRNPGNVPFREIERLEVRAEGPIGRYRCRQRRKAGSRGAGFDPSPCAESQCRSGASPGSGGSGEDCRPRRRERSRRAIRTAGRRHCQSAHAPGRSADP